MSNEELIFEVQNHFEREDFIIKTRIDSLEGNNAKRPEIYEKKDKIRVIIPEVMNHSIKRLNCKIECYISSNYKLV